MIYEKQAGFAKKNLFAAHSFFLAVYTNITISPPPSTLDLFSK